MNIDTKIGIVILVWCLVLFFMSTVTDEEDSGKHALPFWATVIAVAIYLILP